MASAAGLAAVLPAPGAPAIHPLAAWRRFRGLSIAQAARDYGAFVGRPIAYQVWRGWEADAGAPHGRVPQWDDMRGLFLFTRGQVRPDHFFDIAPLRRMLALARERHG